MGGFDGMVWSWTCVAWLIVQTQRMIDRFYPKYLYFLTKQKRYSIYAAGGKAYEDIGAGETGD